MSKDVVRTIMQWEAFVARVKGRGGGRGTEATPVKQKGHGFGSSERDDIMHMADGSYFKRRPHCFQEADEF